MEFPVICCAFGMALFAGAGAMAAQTQTPAFVPAPAPEQSGPAQPASSAPAAAKASAAVSQSVPAKKAAEPGPRDRRRAAKLYLTASKLFLDRQFEAAMKDFERAAALDPTNANYGLAAGVARDHAATALIQAAAKDRLLGKDDDARAALERARLLDPRNIEIAQHLDELADDATRGLSPPLYSQNSTDLEGPVHLEARPERHDFHLRRDSVQVIEQVFEAYGVTAMLDSSVHSTSMRFDLDNADFTEAVAALGLATKTFFVPLDAHRALVAADTPANRRQFIRQDAETVYLDGLSSDEMTEVQSIAKNIFAVPQAALSTSDHALVLRAPERTLEAFNTMYQSLFDGRSQVVLDVRLIQVAHTSQRSTGVQLPQSFSAFNVYAEEQSLLSANASTVQEIISSGLASASDPLAILGILVASGQVSSSLLSSGFALFGGGLTQSALELGSTTVNLNVNSSDSRELDQVRLRLDDGEKGTLKLGEKYPIMMANYSSPTSGTSGLAGLLSAGTSSNLSSLLSTLSSASMAIPMVQYEDLGLNLTVTPKVLRNGDVALTIDMKLDALSGSSEDGNPILDNRSYSGVVTVKEGEATVVGAEIDKSQSLAISGTPGLSEIPGLNNVTGQDLQQNYATLVIVMTPHIVRGLQAAGCTPMMRIDKNGVH